jgi:hypothetical protein
MVSLSHRSPFPRLRPPPRYSPHTTQATKLRADQLESWERAKLSNELQVAYATKELQSKRTQARELEALQKRIQRGRDEHKEHWLAGAQRLMQSHRNMLADLRTKQSIEQRYARRRAACRHSLARFVVHPAHSPLIPLRPGPPRNEQPRRRAGPRGALAGGRQAAPAAFQSARQAQYPRPGLALV